MRQRFPDGPTWVRTEPIAFAFDWHVAEHEHDWHQLTYAVGGHLELETPTSRALVPPEGAVWVPAGTRHRESMWSPVTVRTLYLAPGAVSRGPSGTRTLAIRPLLRELILRACDRGALHRERPRDGHVIDLLLDELEDAPDMSFLLPTPRDPRARRVAELLRAAPGRRETTRALARRAAASPRTLERLFLAETGRTLGQWRRRHRMLHARRLLDAGRAVSDVATAVGYATPSAFTAAFRRELGAAPTALHRHTATRPAAR